MTKQSELGPLGSFASDNAIHSGLATGAELLLAITLAATLVFTLRFHSRRGAQQEYRFISHVCFLLFVVGLGELTEVWAFVFGHPLAGVAMKIAGSLAGLTAIVLAWPETSWEAEALKAARGHIHRKDTRRKGARWLEQKSQTDRDFLQTIIDNASSVIFVKSTDGRYLLINNEYQKLYGQGQDEISGKTDFDLFPRPVAEVLRLNDRRVLETGQVLQIEEIVPHDDGPHYFVSVKFPIRDAKGRIYAIGGVATDITHIKRVEDELRTANVFLDSVIEHIPDMIFIKEAKELRFVRFNCAGENLLGLKREDLLGKNDYDLFPPDQADFFVRKDREVLNANGFVDIEFEPIDTKVLGRRYLHTKKIALTDERGEPEFLLGISQDITEQREARARLESAHLDLERRVTERTEELKLLNEQLGKRLIELEEAEEKFRLAVESAPNAMVMIDAKGTIVLVNAETEHVFGYSRDELLGRSVELLVPERYKHEHPLWGEDFASLGARKMAFVRELYGCRKDGTEIPIEIGLNPIRTNQGRFVLSAIVDVTARKTADEFMRKALREKDLLLKEIHHRVKNNMQVISSLLKLQSAYLPNEETRRLFKQSDDRVRSMALIHERLYRSEGVVDIDFSEYIKELSQNLFHSYVVDSARLVLRHELEPVLLGIDQAIPCGLILNEVVSNSLKHAFGPGQAGFVLIRLTKSDDEQIILQVQDNGNGLPDTFSLDQPTSLGMEIVRTLAEQVEGTLDIEGKGGTCFTLRFRRVDHLEKRRTIDGNGQHPHL